MCYPLQFARNIIEKKKKKKKCLKETGKEAIMLPLCYRNRFQDQIVQPYRRVISCFFFTGHIISNGSLEVVPIFVMPETWPV